MPIGAKETKQIKFLLGFVVLCLIVAAVIFREKFIPSPTASGRSLPEAVRFTLPVGEAERLFERQDYKSLEQFGEVPVTAEDPGSTKIFD